MQDMQHVLIAPDSKGIYSAAVTIDSVTNFTIDFVDTQQVYSTNLNTINVNGAVLDLAVYLPACLFDRYILFWISRSPNLILTRNKIILSTHVGATERFYETKINLISRYAQIITTNNFAALETASVYLEATVKGA